MALLWGAPIRNLGGVCLSVIQKLSLETWGWPSQIDMCFHSSAEEKNIPQLMGVLWTNVFQSSEWCLEGLSYITRVPAKLLCGYFGHPQLKFCVFLPLCLSEPVFGEGW